MDHILPYIEAVVIFTAWAKFIPRNISAMQGYVGSAKSLSSENFRQYGI